MRQVNEEMDDSLVRVDTTATSLDAKQDRGNINKTRSNATLNEPSSPVTSSGSGLKCQETMGDTIAQTSPSQFLVRKIPICYDDDDDEYSFATQEYLKKFSSVITPDLPKSDSLIMEDKHLDTIPQPKSDELIKSSVEDLVHTPSESDGISESECDFPVCDDSSPKKDEVLDDIISIPSGNGNDNFNAESSLIESVLNRDNMISSPKIDFLLEEFTGKLALIAPIPPGIVKADFDSKGDIHFIENLMYDNSFPCPPETLKDDSKTIIDSNNDYSSSDNDSIYSDDIDYVEASPPDFELVSLEVVEIVIPEVGGIDTGSHGSNLYTISIEDMMKSYPICLLSKASKNKSWLWHRRLNHLNFGTINELARKDLVRGLPRLKFEKDHLCSACQLGKRKKHTHKPKTENTNLEVLNTLHMDLCGPMRVQTINGKKYILVIVDDYSRFTWVKFLRSKDETPETVLRTPQQNGVVERRNRTLIEAARTMLIFSKAPMFLLAEAVAIACYTQNRSLIHTRYCKTPYELVHDKKPNLTFFRVFGALCYPTNDSEDLGKLQPTVDIGIFVGYAPSRKGFDETKEQKNETRRTNLALWDSRRLEVKQYSIMCGASARMHIYNKQQFLIEDEVAASHHLWFMMIIGFLVSSCNLVTTTKCKDLVIPVLCQTKVSAARVKRSFVLMLLASKVFNAAYSSAATWDDHTINGGTLVLLVYLVNAAKVNSWNVSTYNSTKNSLHYQDYEWYEALEDSKLKEDALRNKAIIEGLIDDDNDDESHHEADDREELCEIHELSVCNIRRFEMIKYSFGQDEEYVVVKEDEYNDLGRTNEDACRAYQEIFRMMDEGWMVTRAE
ncbi:retrovirus-related pol polyprotein from transposon TNT 1-94 [Tanacetum coccineum]